MVRETEYVVLPLAGTWQLWQTGVGKLGDFSRVANAINEGKRLASFSTPSCLEVVNPGGGRIIRLAFPSNLKSC